MMPTLAYIPFELDFDNYTFLFQTAEILSMVYIQSLLNLSKHHNWIHPLRSLNLLLLQSRWGSYT